MPVPANLDRQKGGCDAPVSSVVLRSQPWRLSNAVLVERMAPISSRGLHFRLFIAARRLAEPGGRLMAHSKVAEIYPRYRIAGYWIAVAIMELLESALERARELDDPVAVGLVPYLERHIVEEQHHEEVGGLDLLDLAVLGATRDEIFKAGPPVQIKPLVQILHEKIADHPVASLGFLQLEQFHPDPKQVERLIVLTGLPRAAFSNLELHAHLDVGHALELDRIVDTLPLSRKHGYLILSTAKIMFRTVRQIFLDVVEAG